MGDVVEETDGDPALDGREKRCQNEATGVGFEADVVHREIEARLRLREEAGEQARDIGGTLPAVGEGRQPDCCGGIGHTQSRPQARSWGSPNAVG